MSEPNTAPEAPVEAPTPAASESAPAAPLANDPAPVVADTPAEATPAPTEPAGKYETAEWVGEHGDWRLQITGGEEDKTLERLNTPEDLYKSYNALRQKMSSGEMLTKLPDNPSDNDVQAYREQFGIPDNFKDYEYSLPKGMEFGEEDQPFIEGFLERAHSKHTPPEIVNEALNYYAESLEKQAVEIQEKDKADHMNFEDAMRNEWGTEYRANINMIENFIGQAPAEVAESLQHARGADGTALLNDTKFVNWMSGIVRELNPAASIVKTTGRDSMSAIESEIKELEKDMNSDINKWHKSPDKKERHRELLGAREKLKKRS